MKWSVEKVNRENTKNKETQNGCTVENKFCLWTSLATLTVSHL